MPNESEPKALGQITEVVGDREFACTFGQMVVKKEQFWHGFYGDPQSPDTAIQICNHLYGYSQESGIATLEPEQPLKPEKFASFIAVFPQTKYDNSHQYMESILTLLINMHKQDQENGYAWARGVSNDPKSKNFSFSIGGQAWFVPFLHPLTYAPARRMPVMCAVFNSHRLFEALRHQGKYGPARNIIRQRQLERFGFIPPLLEDFGEGLEFPQYVLSDEADIDEFWQMVERIGGKYPFGSPNGI